MFDFRRKSGWLVPTIIAINVVVYMMWAFQGESPFMINNFLVSWDSLSSGRWWTALTAVFSHNMLWHILLNMMVLSSFGGIVEQSLGSKFFVRFYLLAGIISSVVHAVVSAWLLESPELPALGASGAISGLVLLFALMYPKTKILLFGIIPLPALWGASLFIGIDLYGLFSQVGGGGLPIGHGAHLGGAFTGIVAYFLYVRSRRPQVFRL